MATISFSQDAAFEPDDIRSMSAALDDICKQLALPDGDHPARRVIAERIIDLARRGERSPSRLRDRIIQEANLGDSVA